MPQHKNVNRLSNVQCRRLENWVAEQHAAGNVDGNTRAQLAATASAALGFDVTIPNVKTAGDVVGVPTGRPRVRQADRLDVAGLAAAVVELYELVDNVRHDVAAVAVDLLDVASRATVGVQPTQRTVDVANRLELFEPPAATSTDNQATASPAAANKPAGA
jgi:hypothetical protein